MKRFKIGINFFLSICIMCVYVTHVQAQDAHDHSQHLDAIEESKTDAWTCSMHPQIKLNKPGQCPICGMNLIPVEKEHTQHSASIDKNTVALKLSETAQKLAEIRTSKVVRKSVEKEIRLVGSLDYDETRLTHITAWVPGRIDRMFVDYTGISVKEDDHMLEIYSPELISAQEELIQATRSLKRLKNSSSSIVRKSTERAASSAEEKLLLLGLTESQVQSIKSRGKAEDSVTIYAPLGGVVVERNATEGMYVQKGTRIYSIADLSSLWVYFDAYESDLPWIRYGQKVVFTTKAHPGETFEGQVSFISPIVNTDTRTTRVRVIADNSKGLLKPGLFVNGTIKASVYGEGKIINANFKGKFIGPMHPEVVKDSPGQCPICGMDLVPAEELGYVTEPVQAKLPLLIPDTAPLITGKRAVVYVKRPGSSIFELRNVVLGPEVGDHYIVKTGLVEGEEVVSKGAFKIDADLQIRGEQSMMNPKKVATSVGHNH